MRSLATALLGGALLACGGDRASAPSATATPPDDGAPPPARVVPGAPMEGLARLAWSFVPFPETRCDDGTPTGLGVSPGDEDGLVVYLDGGGACWDALTCVTLDLSRHGPWGEAQLRSRLDGLGGSIFDRADPANPFRGWSHVFLPYCTSDVHSGDRATTYAAPDGPRTLEHRGRANALAFARRIAATFPAARRVVVAGSSAGGYGSLVNYEALRAAFPGATGYLVDDSGPAVRGLPSAAERDAWWRAWGSTAALATFCAACADDLSLAWPALSRRWPGDRLALLSSLRDETMRGYLLTDAATLERAVRATATEVIAPLPNAAAFLVPGSSHTMLGATARFEAGGVALREWLRQMVDGDPAWRSRGP